MKKQPVKTVNPFFMKGMNPFSGINPFADPASKIPALKIDTEAHFSAEKKVLRYVVFDEELEICGSGTNITFEQFFTEESAAMDALNSHDRLLRYVSENGRTFREYYNKDTGEWA